MALDYLANDEASYYHAQWANDDGDDRDSVIAFLTMDDAAEIENSLANSAFVHRRSIPATTAAALAALYRHLQSEKQAPFDGVLFETESNRQSGM